MDKRKLLNSAYRVAGVCFSLFLIYLQISFKTELDAPCSGLGCFDMVIVLFFYYVILFFSVAKTILFYTSTKLVGDKTTFIEHKKPHILEYVVEGLLVVATAISLLLIIFTD